MYEVYPAISCKAKYVSKEEGLTLNKKNVIFMEI